MEEKKVGCADCGAPYGEDGWCDVVIPDEIWNQIDKESGILCFRCMTKRLEANGFDKVPVIVASGPYRDANEEWRMIGWNHGYKVGKSEVESPPVEGELLPCPLPGRWRYSKGVICCGSIRIAQVSIDTNPSEEFIAELMKWVIDTLNTRQKG